MSMIKYIFRKKTLKIDFGISPSNYFYNYIRFMVVSLAVSTTLVMLPAMD